MTIVKGVVYEKSMIFEVLEHISARFLHSSINLFDSKILPTFCDKYQKFDYECSSYPGSEVQSPDFRRFLTIFGIFQAVCFGRSL